MAAAKGKDGKQSLPSKEASQFKSILKFYEQKQHKKALKLAEGILKKYPDHGETLCLKGLVISQLDRSEEAYELVKKGLMLNMKSHISWHVYGLLYRSDQNYKEAIKCYQNALKYDSENSQIIRDVCTLQIQTRDLKGYQKTRKKLVQKQPNNRANWIGFSMAHHMGGNYKVALAIWDLYYSTLDRNRERPSYEESEMLMYKAMILEDWGKLQECFEFLTEMDPDIVDRVGLAEKKAGILLRLSRFEEAEAAFAQMLERNPENYEYHRGYQAALLRIDDVSDLRACELPVNFSKPSTEQQSRLKQYYDDMAGKHPRVWAYQRIPLDFLHGDEFKSRLEVFFKKCLRKGIPSLFSMFKPIYKIASNQYREEDGKSYLRQPSEDAVNDAKEKVEIIGSLIGSFLSALRDKNNFPEESGPAEPPTVFLWTLVLQAQHLEMMNKLSEALSAINEAIDHTPTLVDLFKIKAQILKHSGDLEGCTDAVEKGRVLDLADRYINTKATKYLLRADKTKRADEVISLFTKHEGDSQANLFEMQCMWYEIEAGKSFFRLGDIPRSLKYFTAVDKHFDDFIEDQFDFHAYCLRKVTLRSYVELLHLEDRIRGHKYYALACHGAVSCYLRIHDMPALFKEEKEEDLDFSKMTAAEKKKAKQKARKAALKKQKDEEEAKKKEEEKKAALEKAQKESGKRRTRKLEADKDPDGKIAFDKIRKDPLQAAWDLLQKLKPNGLDKIQMHLDVFDVAVRMKKYALCISALKNGAGCVSSGIEHPEIHWRLVALMNSIEKETVFCAPWASASTNPDDVCSFVNLKMDINPIVLNAVKGIGSELLGKKSASVVAEEYFNKYQSSDSALRKLAGTKALIMIKASNPEKIFESFVNGEKDNQATKLETSIKILEFLRGYCQTTAIVDSFVSACRVKYPMAAVFQK